MREYLPIIIMMNNYFHDMATAFLAVSAITFIGINKWIKQDGLEKNKKLLEKIFKFFSRIALFTIAWIVVGGVPRVIFFKRYEWWDAASKGIISALIVKHVVMFVLVGGGIYLWLRIRKTIK